MALLIKNLHKFFNEQGSYTTLDLGFISLGRNIIKTINCQVISRGGPSGVMENTILKLLGKKQRYYASTPVTDGPSYISSFAMTASKDSRRSSSLLYCARIEFEIEGKIEK